MRPKSNDKQAKEIHVEVACENALATHSMFSELYGLAVNTYPLGMWMLYVITPSPSLTSQVRDGVIELRYKQVWAPESLGHGQNWDIIDLDTLIKTHLLSLCSMIISIHTKDNKKRCSWA